MNSRKNILVILGPTATGKSDLAVELAKKFNGEIISADSRQVYIGLDIGTGKITPREMKSVPHHLLDTISPKKKFSVAEWKKLAEEKISDIISRGHIPIIVGGTGFYIQALVDNITLPEVSPNEELRKELSKKSPAELFVLLKKLDPARAKTIDAKNPVRLIRAIEIATTLGTVPKVSKKKPGFEFLQIGLTLPPEKLREKIHTRLLTRLKQGMIEEAKSLHKGGLSYARMRQLGLEYGALADFLQKKISQDELILQLNTDICRYAKRQMTWFKRDSRIRWFSPMEKTEINTVVKNFLKQ